MVENQYQVLKIKTRLMSLKIKCIQFIESLQKIIWQKMKIRNNSSKAFHNYQYNNKKAKSLSLLVDAITSKIQTIQDEKSSINAFKQIIQRCYNNRKSQSELCEALKIPFVQGPISLNALPDSFFHQQYLTSQEVQTSVLNQITYLLEFLKKTKEYYYCWIIYYNQQLKILTVKMMKKYELKQNIELLNSKYCMIGIFIDRQVVLNYKLQNKSSIPYQLEKQKQKTPALSFYHSKKQYLGQKIKTQKKLQNVVQKVNGSQSIISLKSIKSSSKTNSSSFKNQQSNKLLQNQIFMDETQNNFVINRVQKVSKNFKKKKQKLVVFAQTKIGKSISSKFESPKSRVLFLKSQQKMFDKQGTNQQAKKYLFRSISNCEKVKQGVVTGEKSKKQLKQKAMLDSNKLQIKIKKLKDDLQNQNIPFRNKNICKARKLSKSNKIYSSCGSLNLTIDSNKTFLSKKSDDKINANFIKRKISTNKQDFKKKKIHGLKFQSSSKNSFQFQ